MTCAQTTVNDMQYKIKYFDLLSPRLSNALKVTVSERGSEITSEIVSDNNEKKKSKQKRDKKS